MARPALSCRDAAAARPRGWRIVCATAMLAAGLVTGAARAEIPAGPGALRPASGATPEAMLGLWCLHVWAEPEFPGKLYEGYLRFDRVTGSNTLDGEMYIAAANMDSFARQTMTFTLEGPQVTGVGTIVEGLNWAPDVIRLTLEGNRLSGGGIDVNRETFRASFDRGDCQRETV